MPWLIADPLLVEALELVSSAVTVLIEVPPVAGLMALQQLKGIDAGGLHEGDRARRGDHLAEGEEGGHHWPSSAGCSLTSCRWSRTCRVPTRTSQLRRVPPSAAFQV